MASQRDVPGVTRGIVPLLRSKGVTFEDIDTDTDPGLRQEMTEKSGGTTVPQVFINGKPVGGYTDIAALEQTGELDKLLAEES